MSVSGSRQISASWMYSKRLPGSTAPWKTTRGTTCNSSASFRSSAIRVFIATDDVQLGRLVLRAAAHGSTYPRPSTGAGCRDRATTASCAAPLKWAPAPVPSPRHPAPPPPGYRCRRPWRMSSISSGVSAISPRAPFGKPSPRAARARRVCGAGAGSGACVLPGNCARTARGFRKTAAPRARGATGARPS